MRRRGTGQICLLTAGHVLTATGARVGDLIVARGPKKHARDVTSEIATLGDSTLFAVRPAGCKADVAIAVLNIQDAYNLSVPAIGFPQHASGRVPAVGEYVQMFGGTSGYRRGIVARVEHQVCYEIETADGRREVCFRDLVLCTRFTSAGDSGAAILNMQQEIVGIHMGGSDSSSFFCKIDNVCDLLDIDIMVMV
ncbi:MAG: trypsin-like peptidase domain-containing protein [Rhodospirillaceae bacterium]|nr:trypsin-like peptidase domain-containing protein [Rhodospirillaceae bacterium]